MKKILILILGLIFSLALFTACATSASSSHTAPASSTVPSTSSPIPSDTPSAEPSAAQSADQNNEKKVITHDGWQYYLDEKDSAVINYNEDPLLHMKKEDGSQDQDLAIRGFNFDIIGDYIYVDSKDPDVNAHGYKTWITVRMKLDGTDKKELEYGSMSQRFIPEGAQKFYFTSMAESAVYISDYSSENVAALIVNLPDRTEIDKKLGNDKVLQLDINDVKDGLISFSATFSNLDGIELYNGSYTITEDGKTVNKVKGTYIDISNENEAD